MCLRNIYTEGKRKRWLAKRPQWIKVYKIVHGINECWTTGDYAYHLKAGKNVAPNNFNPITVPLHNSNKFDPITVPLSEAKPLKKTEYLPYFHSFTKRKSTKDWECTTWHPTTVITCYINKDTVTCVGRQSVTKEAIVSTEIIAPTYPRKTLSIEEKQKFGII